MLVAGIIVRAPPTPTSIARENFGVGEGTFTVATPGVIRQVGIYCPIAIAEENAVVSQKWIRNGTEVTSTTPDIITSVVGSNGRTYRLVEDFDFGVPATCIEYVCTVEIDNEEFSEDVEVCGRGTL